MVCIEIDSQCIYEKWRLDALPRERFSEFSMKNGVYLCLGRAFQRQLCVCVCVHIMYSKLFNVQKCIQKICIKFS